MPLPESLVIAVAVYRDWLKNICAVFFATLCLQVFLQYGVRSVFCQVCLSLVVVAAFAIVEWQLRPGRSGSSWQGPGSSWQGGVAAQGQGGVAAHGRGLSAQCRVEWQLTAWVEWQLRARAEWQLMAGA